MIAHIATIFTLLISAIAYPFTSLPDIDPNWPLPGSCPSIQNLPTEPQYIIGYRQFCSTYLPPSQTHTIKESNPLVATFDLSTPSGSSVKWIYKISAADDSPALQQAFTIDQTTCERKFAEILDQRGGGMLGKSYCVVDGTGGDGLGGRDGKEGMSGEGKVLVMGGETREEGQGWQGRLEFETRRREGT